MSGALDLEGILRGGSPLQDIGTTLVNILEAMYKLQIALSGGFLDAGVTPFQLASAASTNATSVSAVPTVLRNCSIINTTGTTYFLKLYNKASAPNVGTDIPVQTVMAVGNDTTPFLVESPISFSIGLAIAFTAGVGPLDNTAAAVGCLINLGYT